jgi:OOP family OmpA-OmpF porin
LKNIKWAGKIFFTAALLAFSTACLAEPYLGVGAGSAIFGYKSDRCTNDLGYPCQVSSSDTGAKIFAGYHLTENAAVEVSYVDFGKMTGTALTPVGIINLQESEKAADIAFVGSHTFDNNFVLSGRVGWFSAKVSTTGAGAGVTASADDTARNFLIGLGAGYNFTSHILGKVEFERFIHAGESKTNIDLASVAIAYNF